MATAAFDGLVGLEPAPLDVLVAGELVAVVVGGGVCRVINFISNEDGRGTGGDAG
jgi:hypothetical protein